MATEQPGLFLTGKSLAGAAALAGIALALGRNGAAGGMAEGGASAGEKEQGVKSDRPAGNAGELRRAVRVVAAGAK